MTLPNSRLGRRAALALFGSSVLALVLAACAGAEPPRRRRDDGKPFWEREEQRD